MESPVVPRLDFAYRKACEFIQGQPVRLLPVNPFELIKTNHWGMISYKKLAEISDVTVEDIIRSCDSKDGYTIYNGKNYCIAYNSEISIFGRIVFTLMHEIGHIYLGHFAEPGVIEIGSRQYRAYEKEADLFASNVMAPSVIIQKCHFTTIDSLRCASGMSYEAAETRLLQYKSWKPVIYDNLVQKTMQEYIKVSQRQRVDMRSFDIWWEDQLCASL